MICNEYRSGRITYAVDKKNGRLVGKSFRLLVLFVASAAVLHPSQAADNVGRSNHAPVLLRPIQNRTIQEKRLFEFNLRPTGSVYFGYDVGGEDLTITDNYFASHVKLYKPWTKVVFTGNTHTLPDQSLVALNMLEESKADYEWDGNHYFSPWRQPFVLDRAQTWDSWRGQTSFDRASSFTTRFPPTSVFVRANQYEPGRGHVIVCNWDRLDQVELDLSPIVPVGASFKVYNVLSLKGKPVLADVFDGRTVTLPMTSVAFPSIIGHRPPAGLFLDREFSTFLVVSSTASPTATGNSFYVSPTGSAGNDGSKKHPWDLATAMSHPKSVRSGDTIWLLGGTYRGGFTSNLSGTEQAPIHVREMPGEDVRIDLHDTSNEPSKLISIDGQHTWYWGFEVLSSDPSARVTSEAGSWPESITRGNLNVVGDHIKLINLEIHDLKQGLGFWSAGTGGEAYGLIIYNNGWSGDDRNHGHGIYTQNEGATRRLVDNVIFNQFRNGIMVYGSSDAVLENYHIEGNVLFANGGAVGEGYNGSFQLLVGGGTLAKNITVTKNLVYDLPCHFRDQDSGDTLTYSAQCVDGRPLPTWLNFAANEGFFYGTPGNEDVGAVAIRVTASDSAGATATDEFELRIANVNDRPQLIAPLDDLESNAQTPLLADFSGHFNDEDADDKLTLSATLANGQALPNGLSFDPETGILSGRAVVPKPTTIRITATDASGASVSGTFELLPAS